MELKKLALGCVGGTVQHDMSGIFDYCRIAGLTELHPATGKGFEGGATTAHIDSSMR